MNKSYIISTRHKLSERIFSRKIDSGILSNSKINLGDVCFEKRFPIFACDIRQLSLEI